MYKNPGEYIALFLTLKVQWLLNTRMLHLLSLIYSECNFQILSTLFFKNIFEHPGDIQSRQESPTRSQDGRRFIFHISREKVYWNFLKQHIPSHLRRVWRNRWTGICIYPFTTMPFINLIDYVYPFNSIHGMQYLSWSWCEQIYFL